MAFRDQEYGKKLKRLNKSIGCSSSGVDTSHWVFHEKCPYKFKYGPYESAWRDKFDHWGKPLKEIVATSKSCLPKIATASMLTPKGCMNSVYSRFNIQRHKRKEEIREIEETVFDKRGDVLRKGDSRKSNVRGEFSTAWSEQPPNSAQSDASSTLKSSQAESEASTESKRKTSLTADLEAIISNGGNPYSTWAKPPRLSRHDKKKKKAALQIEQENQMMSQAEERVDILVQILCDSIITLGGNDNNIEPITVQHLFASGYDTTPAMSEGIALVKPGDLPHGLKTNSPASRHTINQGDVKRMLGDTSAEAFKKIYKSGRHAYRFGAYYLNPNIWEWMRKDESLSDPRKKLFAEEISELNAKRKEMAEEMSQLHILTVYAEWLRNKGARIPECVLEAERFKSELEERERLRTEAENKAKHEYMMKKRKGL